MKLSFFVSLATVAFYAACAKGDVSLIEGDIVLDRHVTDVINGMGRVRYDGMGQRKWPGGYIPYVFDATLDSRRVSVIQEAIAEYNKHTCIRFVPRKGHSNYVRFKRAGGCWSSIGMVGRGRQDISLGSGCDHKGIAMHEMMHAAGFFHEQSRRDRDNHVVIHWENIRRGMEFNFQKYDHGEADTYGEPYDLDSIMHYSKYSFSVNRKPTIEAKNNPNRKLGQRGGFSPIDIRQLNKMYNCNGIPIPTVDPSEAPSKAPTSKATAKPTILSSTRKPFTTEKPNPSGCNDLVQGCSFWKMRGFCQRSDFKDFMRKNCCKSCRS